MIASGYVCVCIGWSVVMVMNLSLMGNDCLWVYLCLCRIDSGNVLFQCLCRNLE